MLRTVWMALCLGLGFAGAAPAQEERSVRAYVWGNSLINHPTASEGTAVPWWLARMAGAAGRELALSGQYAFGGQFPDKLPPLPEWGAMISRGRTFILDQWWVATMPGFAIIVVSLGFCFLGDGLRDVLDPKQGGKS